MAECNDIAMSYTVYEVVMLLYFHEFFIIELEVCI